MWSWKFFFASRFQHFSSAPSKITEKASKNSNLGNCWTEIIDIKSTSLKQKNLHLAANIKQFRRLFICRFLGLVNRKRSLSSFMMLIINCLGSCFNASFSYHITQPKWNPFMEIKIGKKKRKRATKIFVTLKVDTTTHFKIVKAKRKET